MSIINPIEQHDPNITLLAAFHKAKALGLDLNTGRAFTINRRWLNEAQHLYKLQEKETAAALRLNLDIKQVKAALQNARYGKVVIMASVTSQTAETLSDEPPLTGWQPMTLWREV